MTPAMNPMMSPGSPKNSPRTQQMQQMQQSNCVNMQNVGTVLGLTPRASADGVVTMQLDIDDCRSGPAEEGVPIFIPSKGEPVRTPVVDTFKAQTTLKIADGQTVVVSGMARQPKNGKQRVILVTPHVLPIGGEAKQAR
jgi:type II secretory pathway component GspD/PulD (secretin)